MYLKKKKMYEIMKNVFGSDMPKMKECHYMSFRGAEWLKFHLESSYNFVSFYHYGFTARYSVSSVSEDCTDEIEYTEYIEVL